MDELKYQMSHKYNHEPVLQTHDESEKFKLEIQTYASEYAEIV